jgi:hypothetical protein
MGGDWFVTSEILSGKNKTSSSRDNSEGTTESGYRLLGRQRIYGS